MRAIPIVAICLIISACGDSGGNAQAPASVPITTVSGSVTDSAINNATVTAYSFSSGVLGSVLGSGTTSSSGAFSFSIQAESTPMILVAKGGYYVEEATNTTINLGAEQSLRTVINHSTGVSDKAYITPLTNLAAGLATYKIKQGTTATTAISSANTEINNVYGFDVMGTIPIDITSPTSATANPTPGHYYGLIGAAISNLTLYASQKSGGTPHLVHNSIAFSQLMYADVVADGLLDGYGKDATSAIIPLSLGVLPMSQSVYRHGIAAHIITAVNSAYNKSGLTEAQVVIYASGYASNGDSIWAAAPALSFGNSGRPTVSITSPAVNNWVSKSFTVSGAVSDVVNVDASYLLVDGGNLGAATNPLQPVYLISTAGSYADGIHSLTLTSTNTLGVIGKTIINVGVDNTYPTATGSILAYTAGETYVTWTIQALDAGSGIAAVYAVPYAEDPYTSGTRFYFNQQGDGSWRTDILPCSVGICGNGGNLAFVPVVVKDNKGNCTANDFAGGAVLSGIIRVLSNGQC